MIHIPYRLNLKNQKSSKEKNRKEKRSGNRNLTQVSDFPSGGKKSDAALRAC